MNRRRILPLLVLAVLTAACGEEKRDGQLTLSGSAPVRIVDQSGAAVEFVSGPLKVEFGADSGRKFTVSLDQNGRKARFSGQAPDASDWNFTVRGRDIGQPVDLASARSVTLYGPVRTQMGSGTPCGMNGMWETEEQWRSGNEDWSVAFTDAQSGAALGTFKSRRENQSYLVGTRNLWCRVRPQHEPHGRWAEMSDKLSALQDAGVKFQ